MTERPSSELSDATREETGVLSHVCAADKAECVEAGHPHAIFLYAEGEDTDHPFVQMECPNCGLYKMYITHGEYDMLTGRD